MLTNDGDIGGRYKSDYCLCQAWASPLTEGLANTGGKKYSAFSATNQWWEEIFIVCNIFYKIKAGNLPPASQN